jgi:hypothetical protein
MTDTTLPEFDTVQDILDEANGAPYNTILRIWREVLAPAAAERDKAVSPQWANRICSTYRELRFADMEDFRDIYFGKIMELAEILDLEINGDDECLSPTTPEEDVEANSHHYLNVLFDWQKAFMLWEKDWRCFDDTAAVELAAISEVHKMFFEPTGIVSLLDNIKFEFTDDHRAALQDELAAVTTSRED